MTSETGHRRGLERNVRLYPWYAVLFNAFFWMPVFFLYFGEHLSLGEVLGLEAVYYVSVVVLEVPSGYLSDKLGRKLTLMLSAASLTAAYVLFFVAPALGATFAVFSVAQVLLAGGIAANSGTDTSFHHDSLAALDRGDEYKDREAIVARNALFSTAGAAVLGGLASSLELAYAYGLSAVIAVASIVLLLRFEEPAEDTDPDALHFIPQLGACFRQLGQPRWPGSSASPCSPRSSTTSRTSSISPTRTWWESGWTSPRTRRSRPAPSPRSRRCWAPSSPVRARASTTDSALETRFWEPGPCNWSWSG